MKSVPVINSEKANTDMVLSKYQNKRQVKTVLFTKKRVASSLLLQPGEIQEFKSVIFFTVNTSCI